MKVTVQKNGKNISEGSWLYCREFGIVQITGIYNNGKTPVIMFESDGAEWAIPISEFETLPDVVEVSEAEAEAKKSNVGLFEIYYNNSKVQNPAFERIVGVFCSVESVVQFFKNDKQVGGICPSGMSYFVKATTRKPENVIQYSESKFLKMFFDGQRNKRARRRPVNMEKINLRRSVAMLLSNLHATSASDLELRAWLEKHKLLDD